MISASAADPEDTIRRLRACARPLAPIPTQQVARLERLSGIRAVLFDVYGTLFVSASGDIGSSDEQARSRSLGRALEALGIRMDEESVREAAAVLMRAIREEHRRGKSRGREYPEVDMRTILSRVLDHLAGKGLFAAEADRRFCEILAVEYECRLNPTWPMPGAAQTLRCLSERGTDLGIISNAQFFTPLLFPALLSVSPEKLGFDPELCVWSYRNLEAKPSHALFTGILQALAVRDIQPREVLYVGNDRLNDIWPAARAGMKTALFAGDRRSFRPRKTDPRLPDVAEDILLTELVQLIDVV